MYQLTPQLPNMEFGRRLAIEKELEKTLAFQLCNACECAGSCDLYLCPPGSSFQCLQGRGLFRNELQSVIATYIAWKKIMFTSMVIIIM